MKRRAEETQEPMSIRFRPRRATAIWLLGKLSLVLGIVLLTLPLFFALDLIAGAPRVETDASEVVAQFLPSPVAESQNHGVWLSRRERSGVQATLAAIPDAEMGVGPILPKVTATSPVPQQVSGQAQAEIPLEIVLTDMVAPTLPETALSPLAEAAEATAIPVEETGTIQPATKGTEATLPAKLPDPDGRPVQIRIPSINVKRGIVELPLMQDPETGSWTRDLKVLFRKGRKDLVGHYEQSAQPGQPGNTILAGHNYGHGTKGVFLKLRRLKQGKKIEVVNASGQTFTYRVESVHKIPWKSKDADELIRHARLLAPSGSERLTLVTCGGGKVYPFPARIYVVAEPIRD